jgi:NADP-dependent 3-hydroxy acid dehydrogenase YdfG
MMGQRIGGEIVAITGGARGIGLATARELSGRGALVALGDLDDAGAAVAARGLPSRAWGGHLDVADRQSVAAFLDAVESNLGPIDVLINNAGVMHLGRFEDESAAATAQQVSVNLLGVINGVKEVIPRMRARARGHVINVASVLGRSGLPGAATYAATKHGVCGLSEAVRAELRGSGIAVTVVLPHTVATELASGFRDLRFGLGPVTPEQVATSIARAIERRTPTVWVPRWHALLHGSRALAPVPGRLVVDRLFGADRIYLGADAAKRRAYRERVSRDYGETRVDEAAQLAAPTRE